MATVAENIKRWNDEFDWSTHGQEWSEPWGDTRSLWLCTILPRIHRVIPSNGRILEIATGQGRISTYLFDYARDYHGVEVSKKCVDFLKATMAREGRFFHLTDGVDLSMVPDELDFVLSWDALVHADAQVMERYIEQLARKMRDRSFGFIHHSNFKTYVKDGKPLVDNFSWRDPTVDGDLVRKFCESNGLKIVFQELVPWFSGPLTECFTMFCKDPENAFKFFGGTRVNTCFSDELQFGKALYEMMKVETK